MIRIVARKSPLSLKQVKEVTKEAQLHTYTLHTLDTAGDCDRITSLRFMEKTNFFTRELDRYLLEEKADIAIHSAKDLPDPLPQGLHVIALTKGVDPADSLVLQEGMTISRLPKGARIATSSIRREQNLKSLRGDLTFVDIRGNIDERLAKLHANEVEGVIIAEGALIRLGYTHLNRLRIPGDVAFLQGKLAIVARVGDSRSSLLFSKIDTRSKRRILAVGRSLPEVTAMEQVEIAPLIKTSFTPLPGHIDNWLAADALLFTSKEAAAAIRSLLPLFYDKEVIAIGKKTAAFLAAMGLAPTHTCQNPSSEGVIQELSLYRGKTIFWPHSAGSRSIISAYCKQARISLLEWIAYETLVDHETLLPDPASYSCIYFSSPSAVQAFKLRYGFLPSVNQRRAIGPVTEEALRSSD